MIGTARDTAKAEGGATFRNPGESFDRCTECLKGPAHPENYFDSLPWFRHYAGCSHNVRLDTSRPAWAMLWFPSFHPMRAAALGIRERECAMCGQTKPTLVRSEPLARTDFTDGICESCVGVLFREAERKADE